MAIEGRFAEAWRISDRILAHHVEAPDFTGPRHLQSVWRGDALQGRVLIRCYRGFGDTLQFIRYAPRVRASAREVVVWAPEAVLPLLQTVEGVDRVVPLHDGIPDLTYDVDVEIMELPYVFRSTLHTLPAHVPYLTVSPRTLSGRRPHVGLFWRGGGWDPDRAVPFRALQRLLAIDGVTWWSLQESASAGEADPRLLDGGSGGLVALARHIAALDLVITVDSMPAHLAGALGVPVWTLLKAHADWRWLRGRDTSPWYPSMRLFRQRRDGDWRRVLRYVELELQRWLASVTQHVSRRSLTADSFDVAATAM